MFKHEVKVNGPEKVVVEHRATVLIAPSSVNAAGSLMKTAGKVAAGLIAAKTVHDVAIHIAKSKI